MDWGVFQFADGVAETVVDTSTYSLVAIKKVGYRLAARCSLFIGNEESGRVRLVWTFRPRTSNDEARAILCEFFRELLDQDLRETIARETHQARSVILAHAFSRTSLLDEK